VRRGQRANRHVDFPPACEHRARGRGNPAPTPRNLPGATKGFTLVEVLVALAVLAVVSVTIVGSLSAMTARIDGDREDTQIAFLLRALASDIRLRGIPSKADGSFDTHPDYKWGITVEPFREGENTGGLFDALKEIRLRVVAPSGRAQSARMVVR
jgi:prepilin-type N-terminal cleavage/methylation domain-containing protein